MPPLPRRAAVAVATAVAVLSRAHAASAEELFYANELQAGGGVLGEAYAYAGGRAGDVFVAETIAGRRMVGHVVLDATLLAVFPAVEGGPAAGLTATPRIGWAGQRWAVLAGVAAQVADGAPSAVQVLPSLRAEVSFGSWGLSAGLFDLHGLAPAHLSFEYGAFSVGWVAPIGARAEVALGLGRRVGLRVGAFVFQLLNTQAVLATLSVVSGAQAGAPRARFARDR